MPNPFHNVALTGTDYLEAATISQVLDGNGGQFSIGGGNVWAQLEYPVPAPGLPKSGYGSVQRGIEMPMGTGPGFIPPGVTGIRFRNQDSTKPATVSAVIVGPNEPFIFSATSDVTVTVTGMTITGRCDNGGAIIGGTGFTVVHAGVGLYAITFTTAFAAVPTIVAAPNDNIQRMVSIDSAATTGFTAHFTNWAAGASADCPFSFVAMTTV